MGWTKWANPLTVSIPAKASSSFSATGIRTAPLQEEQASIKHVFLSACTCTRHRHTQVSFNRTKFGLESLFTFFCLLWIPGIGKWVSVKFLSQAWWHTTIIWALGKLRQKCVLFQYQPWLQRPYVKNITKTTPQMSLWSQGQVLETKPVLWQEPRRYSLGLTRSLLNYLRLHPLRAGAATLPVSLNPSGLPVIDSWYLPPLTTDSWSEVSALGGNNSHKTLSVDCFL